MKRRDRFLGKIQQSMSRKTLAFDLEHLKMAVRLIDFEPWIGKYRPWISKKVHFPKSYFNDLRSIAKLYRCFVQFDSDISNSYFSRRFKKVGSWWWSVIWIRSELYENGYPDLKWIAHAFSHELAHSIQWKVSRFSVNTQAKSFEKVLSYELIADRLGYFIGKEYFGHLFDFHHGEFSSYRKKSSRIFLANWYSGFNRFYQDTDYIVENGIRKESILNEHRLD